MPYILKYCVNLNLVQPPFTAFMINGARIKAKVARPRNMMQQSF